MMTIRPVARDDFEKWDRLWQSYIEFYGTTVADEVTKTTWDRFFDDRMPMHCLVVEEEDVSLVGFSTYVVHYATWSVRPVCYLEDLYLDEAVRYRGHGYTLMKAVFEAAKDMDCSKVYWQTQADNKRARRLYDKVAEEKGWVRYDRSLP